MSDETFQPEEEVGEPERFQEPNTGSLKAPKGMEDSPADPSAAPGDEGQGEPDKFQEPNTVP